MVFEDEDRSSKGMEIVLRIFNCQDEEDMVKERAQQSLLQEIKAQLQILQPNEDPDKVHKASVDLVHVTLLFFSYTDAYI